MPELTLTQLCAILADKNLPARLEGPDGRIRAVNTLEDAGPGEITFLANPKYIGRLKQTKAAAALVDNRVEVPSGLTVIRCSDPYAALSIAVVAIHGFRRHPTWGISQQADIAPSARIGTGASIAPNVVIADRVSIGNNCTIYPGCYIAEEATIGNDCVLFPNVVVYDRCTIGNRVTIHAGSVIGQDGLGYAPMDGKWQKIPQAGSVLIGDDVEIGANCAIDRATLGLTEIGPGTKFGNVVVIGHGTKVGPDCLFVGLVGVAGSVRIGRHVTLAGQVGVSGHLSIGDDVKAGGQAGIGGDVEPHTDVLGSPAMPVEIARRAMVALARLPATIRQVRALQKEVEALKKALAEKNRGAPPHPGLGD